MKEQHYNWSAILNNSTFTKLHRKKSSFLLWLWVAGAIPYMLLAACAGYAPELLNIRVIGRMNIGYLFCISQFFMTIGIAIYYAYRTGKDFDPLTKTLLDEIQKGEV